MQSIRHHGLKAALVLALGGIASGCEPRSPVAYGGVNRIIVAMDDTVWAEVQADVQRILEPRIFTVRDERTFELTHISPTAQEWNRLRRFKHLLVVGEADAPWVSSVLGSTRLPSELPALVEGQDIWARGQLATALVLPAGGGAADITAMLPELHSQLDTRFRAYVRDRMFASGRNTELSERLLADAGFALLLPQVYRWTQEDSVYVFRNDWPTPDDLTRSLLVTWRQGQHRDLTPDQVLDWREAVSRTYYREGQQTQRERIETRLLDAFGEGALEVQGIWQSLPGEWPMAGPFLNRVIVCPEQDRTYFLDAWLYAPAKDKYEYMLQLETILDSFECGDLGRV